MQENTKILIQTFLSIIVALFALFALTMIVTNFTKVVNETVEEDEWCFTKMVQPGENFGHGKPGTYSYDLVITSGGIKVYEKCDVVNAR